MFAVLSGLNWRMAERGAGRTSQGLLHNFGSSSVLIPEALSLCTAGVVQPGPEQGYSLLGPCGAYHLSELLVCPSGPCQGVDRSGSFLGPYN